MIGGQDARSDLKGHQAGRPRSGRGVEVEMHEAPTAFVFRSEIALIQRRFSSLKGSLRQPRAKPWGFQCPIDATLKGSFTGPARMSRTAPSGPNVLPIRVPRP